MKVVIQRVLESSVTINREVTASIKKGLMILLGVEQDDSPADIEWLVGKILNLRIFDDAEGQMNLSVKDVEGEILIISQFTLHASTKKGNRPSYIAAARPETAVPLYEEFIRQVKSTYPGKVEQGTFGADMQVSLVNSGPVTIIIDSKNRV